jgi:bacteriorhodopsin
MQINRIEKSFMTFNTIAFIALLIHELKINYPKHIEIQKASTAILGIAATQYSISTFLYDRYPDIAEEIRYIDWGLTTPFLLFTYWKLANTHGYQSNFTYLAAAVLFMVALGYVAETEIGYKSFILSFIPYLYILYEITQMQTMYRDKNMPEYESLGNFFIYGWAIYPLAFYAPMSYKYIIYSIGDFVNKGMYSIMLYKLLEKEV